MRSWFACPVARVARWSRRKRDRNSDWAPGLSARGGEFERRIMVRQLTDRIDEWWNRRVPSQDSTRRALVGKSRKESSKVEALEKPQDFDPLRVYVRRPRRQGSTMNG